MLQMCSSTPHMIPHGPVMPLQLGAGGKPSTWLPPGMTRRAPHQSNIAWFSLSWLVSFLLAQISIYAIRQFTPRIARALDRFVLCAVQNVACPTMIGTTNLKCNKASAAHSMQCNNELPNNTKHISVDAISLNLGKPSREEGRGAKHSPLGNIGVSCIIYRQKS